MHFSLIDSGEPGKGYTPQAMEELLRVTESNLKFKKEKKKLQREGGA